MKIWKSKWEILDWPPKFSSQAKGRKLSVELPTTLLQKFYKQKDIVMKLIFGVLELFAILLPMEDLHSNPKM